MPDTSGSTSRPCGSGSRSDGQPVTRETLAQLPAYVATVVSDYARDGEQRWELRTCRFDLDSLDNLPCRKGSIIEILLPGASYWLRRDSRGGMSFCPLRPLSSADAEQGKADEYVWGVEQTATRHAHIIVWRVTVVSTEDTITM